MRARIRASGPSASPRLARRAATALATLCATLWGLSPDAIAWIIAEYTVREGKFRDVMKNIGAGGLFIRTSRKIKTGQPILLEFPLFRFENNIRVSGQVIRRDHDGFAVAFDEPLEELNGLISGNQPDDFLRREDHQH